MSSSNRIAKAKINEKISKWYKVDLGAYLVIYALSYGRTTQPSSTLLQYHLSSTITKLFFMGIHKGLYTVIPAQCLVYLVL